MKYTLLLAALLPVSVFANSYSTSFSQTENPLSEGGNWIEGGVAGGSWYNVQSVNGHASSAMPGPNYIDYIDPTAVVAGSWGPDQTVQGTVVQGNTWQSDGEEIELRLRTSISPGSITGYEVCWRNYQNGGYVQVGRWNGPPKSITVIGQNNNAYHGIQSGDVISASITGNTISGYVNGVLVVQCTDSTFSHGNPGIGFDFFNNGHGTPPSADQLGWGLADFSATDGGMPAPSPTPSSTPTPQPTPVPYAAWEASLLQELQNLGVRSSQINAVSDWLSTNPPTP